MSQVHGLRGWTPTRVKVEGLTFLNFIQDDVQVSVGKEDSATKKMVNWNVNDKDLRYVCIEVFIKFGEIHFIIHKFKGTFKYYVTLF